MVEMTEAADILHNATENSLVLMDEIGRGTSTFDGLALAWACARHLAQRIRAMTMFATHYFEMTALPELDEGIVNVHLDAVEHGDGIVFLHRVKDGAANRSYGLQVAALAGIPAAVIQEARGRLEKLQAQPQCIHHPSAPEDPQLSLFQDEPTAAIVELTQIDPDQLSPRQALDALYRLKALASK
jgi:DNA mismatch repair protein MutS